MTVYDDLAKKILDDVEGWEVRSGLCIGNFSITAESWRWNYRKDLVERLAKMLEANIEVLCKENYKGYEAKRDG